MTSNHSTHPDLDIPHSASLDINITRTTTEDSTAPTSQMALPPYTSPVPQSIFAPGMSPQVSAPSPAATATSAATKPATATESPLPVRPSPNSEDKQQQQQEGADAETSSSKKKKHWPLPKLRVRIDDITHPGANIFLSSVNAATCLPECVQDVLHVLYSSPPSPPPNSSSSSSSTPTTTTRPHPPSLTPPPTRSVTLILRPMPGVAYTTGIDLDSDHKEIHFSLDYISNSIRPPTPARQTAEIRGVIVHELVHCYQWTASGSCPGGLIEGIADFVRLKCDLAPPHWKRGDGTEDKDGKWDAGYQRTGFFLDYLEGRFGDGTVRKLNEKLRTDKKYEDKKFWVELLGSEVGQLWEDYKTSL